MPHTVSDVSIMAVTKQRGSLPWPWNQWLFVYRSGALFRRLIVAGASVG